MVEVSVWVHVSASDNPPTNYSVGGANGEQSRNGNE